MRAAYTKEHISHIPCSTDG